MQSPGPRGSSGSSADHHRRNELQQRSDCQLRRVYGGEQTEHLKSLFGIGVNMIE